MSIRPRPARSSEAVRRAERGSVQDPEVVLGAAARLLEGRARSVAEVRRRLTGAGYRPELVDAAIERLQALGILDDEAFARAWVTSRDRAHPRGERALRAELREKGIAPDLITALLDERRVGAPDGVDRGPAVPGDGVAAERLLARNERALLGTDDPRRRRQRAWALLARAGFDPETARSAVAELERRWSVGNLDDDTQP